MNRTSFFVVLVFVMFSLSAITLSMAVSDPGMPKEFEGEMAYKMETYARGMDPFASPTVSEEPRDGSVDVMIFTPYLLSFSKEMNTSLVPDIEPSPTGGSWEWDSTSMWCNYSGEDWAPIWESGTNYWVNLTGLEDTEGNPLIGDTEFNFTTDGVDPVLYDVRNSSPRHISRNNRFEVEAFINDSGSIMMSGVFFMRDAGGNSTLKNYTWIKQLEGDLSHMGQDIYKLEASWNATAGYGGHEGDMTAGYLTDGISRDYIRAYTWENHMGDTEIGVDVYFSSGTYDKEEANLDLYENGTPMGVWINGSGQEEWLAAEDFDESMRIIPRVEIVSFHRSGELASEPGVTVYGEYGHEFELTELDFHVDQLVPDGDYQWFVMAADGGMNIGFNMSDTPVSVDNTPPTIISSSIPLGASNVSTDPANYSIHFSETINNTQTSVTGSLPEMNWSWSHDRTWLNISYARLEGGKRYFVHISQAKDLAYNWLSADEGQRNFTTGAPWAVITGPVSDGTNNGTPVITYDFDNNPFEVIIYTTTDGGETWNASFWDKPVDGIVFVKDGLGWTGAYQFSARATGHLGGPEDDEPVPSGPGDIEGGEYVLDMDRPVIASSVPDNWDHMINRSASTYVIEFSEPMNTSAGTVNSTLPNASWEWDDTGRWLNGTYGVLEGSTTYYVNLSWGGFADLVGNELGGTMDLQFHTERGPWARAGWANSDGSYDRRPHVPYGVTNATAVEIYYTSDAGATWTLWGTSHDVDGGNGTWFPDSDLPGPGTYNWNARALGYVNEPMPEGGQSIESDEYLLLPSAEQVEVLTTEPENEKENVAQEGGTYSIGFTDEMEKQGTPISNLPDVKWTWSDDGMWLNGSYGELDPSTTYYVNLQGSGLRSYSGHPLSGDLYFTFTTVDGDEGTSSEEEADYTAPIIIGGAIVLVMVLLVLFLILVMKRKKRPEQPGSVEGQEEE